MSWPARKSAASSSANNSLTNRSPTGSLSSAGVVGLIPRAVQLDFDKEEKKIHEFENTNKKFYKDVKVYVEKIDELNKSESKMINNLTNLVTNNNNNNNSLNKIENSEDKNFQVKIKLWKEFLCEHDNSCENLKQSCQSQVIEPMKKLNSLFPQVYEAIKRRQAAYNELVKQQTKLDRALEKERTGAQIVKIEQLKQMVGNAKQLFEREHSALMDDLPKLYNSRVDYIKPCVTALLESQASFYESYSSFYESVLNAEASDCKKTNKSEKSRDSGAVKQIEDEIQKCLSEIKSLSIVAGD